MEVREEIPEIEEASEINKEVVGLTKRIWRSGKWLRNSKRRFSKYRRKL